LNLATAGCTGNSLSLQLSNDHFFKQGQTSQFNERVHQLLSASKTMVAPAQSCAPADQHEQSLWYAAAQVPRPYPLPALQQPPFAALQLAAAAAAAAAAAEVCCAPCACCSAVAAAVLLLLLLLLLL
jgi:hypothetical protein